jgi:putative hydrolase of the HAD superfamily
MKYLQTEIPWNNIKAIGFDMDGTLYDEFDFIYQVYKPISKLFSNSIEDSDLVFKKMLAKWLKKGSSYPFIFSEIATENGFESIIVEQKTKEALTIFRNFNPVLTLSPRIKFILEEFKKNNELFLVSDGGSILQWNKLKALNLENYFSRENIFISGDYGKHAQKPGLLSLEHLTVLKKEYRPNEIVFIGDRIVDENFAKNAGFYYIDQSQL